MLKFSSTWAHPHFNREEFRILFFFFYISTLAIRKRWSYPPLFTHLTVFQETHASQKTLWRLFQWISLGVLSWVGTSYLPYVQNAKLKLKYFFDFSLFLGQMSKSSVSLKGPGWSTANLVSISQKHLWPGTVPGMPSSCLSSAGYSVQLG